MTRSRHFRILTVLAGLVLAVLQPAAAQPAFHRDVLQRASRRSLR